MAEDRASSQGGKKAGLAEPLLQEGDAAMNNKNLGRQRESSPFWSPLSSLRGAPEKLAVGWQTSLAWSGFITVWYWLLQKLVRGAMRTDAQALKQLFVTVPPRWYAYSESAFATATTLNLLNLVFEDTPDKQQLALLSAVIKGLSWHSDHLITSGLAIVKYDTHGALFVPSRYVQWSCSTPTMIFTLSRISSLSPLETAATMAADWFMVAMGWAASDMAWPWAFVPLTLSFLAFAFVQRMLWRMLHDAMREAGSAHARKCLLFTLGSTIVIWSLFPLAWMAGHITAVPFLAALGEPLTMFCNFAAKVVFSTSIMFNNFVTLAQRRRAAQEAAEHEERLQAVQELSVAVNRKDAFLAVVGHELRTPLNAICQLASALSLGAAGQVTSQAREWLSTIKASASHLLGVVNDIIMFRANQMGLVIKQEVVPLGEVVDEVLRTLLPSAGSTVTLEKVVHARMPPIVADRRRLVLALTNLVANSIKFMDKQNGRVTVKAYPDRGARNVVIKVVDNGPGLSAQQLAHINDAAHTAQIDAFSRRAGGLGLGLPITFQLAAAHGGVVRISSPGPAQGTTALIKLPVMQPATDASLKQDFSAAYQAMGYSLEQLLSPELARSEGRVCPAFVNLAPAAAATAATTAPMDEQALALARKAAAAAAGMPPAASQKQQQQQQSALLVQGQGLGTRAPSFASSTGSSMELSQGFNIRATYMWPGPGPSSGAGMVQSLDSPNPAAAGGAGNNSNANAGGARMSQDSLAAWEAYAEHMGYTLPAGGEGTPGDATPGAIAVTPASAAAATGPSSAAAAPRGVPGQATALMSTLYMPMGGDGSAQAAPHHLPQQVQRHLQQQQRAGGGGGGYKSAAALRAAGFKGSASNSARISIEEGDEEGQESEDGPTVMMPMTGMNKPPLAPGSSGVPSVRGSVDVVGTPTKLMGVVARLSDDVPPGSQPQGQGQDRTTTQLLESAAAATAAMQRQEQQALVTAGLSTSSSTYNSASAPSNISAANRAQPGGATEPAPGGAPSAPEEWEAYLMSGGDPMAPVCRMDAEAVVAANARLSLQYTSALAEAESKGLPLDPTWYAWVARIPDHHKATPQLLQLASQQRQSNAGGGAAPAK